MCWDALRLCSVLLPGVGHVMGECVRWLRARTLQWLLAMAPPHKPYLHNDLHLRQVGGQRRGRPSMGASAPKVAML
jgi:hypothetical protein